MTNVAAFFDNLALPRKLAMLGLIAAMLVAVPLTLYVSNIQQNLAITQTELAGVRPSRALLAVLHTTQQHGGLAAAWLAGQPTLAPLRVAKQGELEGAWAAFDDIIKQDIADPRLRAAWDKLGAERRVLLEAVQTGKHGGAASNAGHRALIGHLHELHELVVDHFGLTLDPERASYYLFVASMQQLPRLTDLLDQVRTRGALVLAQRMATMEDGEVLAGIAEQARAKLRELELTLEKVSEADAGLKAKLAGTAERVRAELDAVLRLAREQILDAKEVVGSSGAFLESSTRAIDALHAINTQAAEALQQAFADRLARDRVQQWSVLAAVASLLAIGLWAGVAIARSIITPVEAARAAAVRIAAGDLSGEVRVNSNNELGQMLAAMRDMQASLTRVVGAVRGNAEGVASASSQIAQGNQDLSMRTETQASALQQTAASMDQLGATVKQSANNAEQANRLALGACNVATQGGEVVCQMVETMRAIDDSSKKIADIIGMIDSIAFQSNILALNAAVEAARAGVQGRGFAVVAGEVRGLARRSAEAARQIKGLINASVERVEQGTLLVDRAGATMNEIVAAIRRVTDIMGEISNASSRQSMGVLQIGQAVGQLDAATQQNAALVQQSAAAAESLSGQAQALVQAVAVFQLSHGRAPAAQGTP